MEKKAHDGIEDHKMKKKCECKCKQIILAMDSTDWLSERVSVSVSVYMCSTNR